MEAGYVIALTTGFIGGFGHCIGMCGPIVAAYSLHDTASSSLMSRLVSHVFYNTGRITTYIFIGALMGLAGSFINVAGRISGVQNVVSLLAGVIMILMGLNITGFLGRPGWLEKKGNFILRAGRGFFGELSQWRYYPLGALFGFLPCGFSYAAFVAAAGTGGFLSGMTLMLFFGLGTFPALFIFGIAASYISMKIRGLLYKASGATIIIMGIYFIVRGMGTHAHM